MQTRIHLTQREIEVLRLLAQGCTYIQVGDRLCMSCNTVATHIKNIYRKLEVHSGRAAVWRALQLRILGELESADATSDWSAELMAAALLREPKPL